MRQWALDGLDVGALPGDDPRHPSDHARRMVDIAPQAHLAAVAFGAHLRTVDDLAATLAPEIDRFATTARFPGPA